MTITIRPGFCLGCGVTGTVKVPHNPYKGAPLVAHPGWCDKPKCQKAKQIFRQTVENIE